FWKLTEDPDFNGKLYSNNYKDNTLYTRKLKAKNGEYRYIQWRDKQFNENLVISIGQDISQQIKIQDQYKNLIQTAADIIFEINKDGYFSFMNEFGLNALGYTEEDFFAKHYTEFVHEDYKENLISFFDSLENTVNNNPII